MITVQINGGLGNQLFQYAAGKSLSLHHGVPLRLDISWFYKPQLHYLEVPREFELHNFIGINDNIVNYDYKPTPFYSPFLKKISFPSLSRNYKKRIYEEPFFHFDSGFFETKSEVILKGQWQSYKYFDRYSVELKKSLCLKEGVFSNSLKTAKHLAAVNSVAVHVRRADYLRLKIILEWHGVMPEDYYRNAFIQLTNRIGKHEVFYFTDDPQWVKEKLLPVRNGKIMSDNFARSHHEDFYLMSHCRHNIIANSSFSWWAAWLNQNPDKIVIAPKQWFNNGPKDTQDLLPESWIKL